MPAVPAQLQFWYRGQANVEWDLFSSVHRFPEDSRHGLLESPIVQSYLLSENQILSERNPLFDILAMMQHYNYPTRLLDWTSYIYSAAYFACLENPDDDGLIWVLNPFKLNEYSRLSDRSHGIALPSHFDVSIRCFMALEDSLLETFRNFLTILLQSHALPSSIYDSVAINQSKALQYFDKLAGLEATDPISEQLSYPIAVEPRMLNPRIKSQYGKFTVSGGKQYYNRHQIAARGAQPIIQPRSMLEHPKAKEFLRCVPISASSKPRLLQELRQYHQVDDGHMMQDLDNHGKVSSDTFKFTRNWISR